jgi:hypothetical protein
MVANLAPPNYEADYLPPLFLTEELRGVIVGISQSNGQTYVQLRHERDQEIKLRVRYRELADEMSSRVHGEAVSVVISGYWERATMGWLPQPDHCDAVHLISFNSTRMGDAPRRVLPEVSDGWGALDDPIAAWKELRGCD